MYRNILIATDGSRNAEAAARYGGLLAEAFDAAVHILSVVGSGAYSDQLADVDQVVREQRDTLEDHARDAVDAIQNVVTREFTTSCQTVIEYGSPYETILACASDRDVDLIVLGSQGRSGLDRVLLGSVAERVVRTSEVPVLTVPRSLVDRDVDEFDSVLIPTDGSPAAEVAVAHGVAVAEQFDATIHVLSVIRTARGLPRLSDPDRIDAEDAVEAVANEASHLGLEVVTRVQAGNPYERIRKFIATREIDLVTMGTQGRSGVHRHLLGSVTEKTLRTSEAPVMTVRVSDTD